jgi:LPS O-antigen subunit length determinant protein (WzzB/FepE family)
MDGWLVGEEIADEEADKEVVEEAKVEEEKLLDKVKKSLTDYLQSVEEKLEKKIDRDLGEKPAARDIGKKDKNDKDLVTTEQELEEDPTEEDPVIQDTTPPVQNPTYAESACVKSMVLENGAMFEIHGNERTGFEIRHGNRTMKSRFKNIDEATMAIEMFRARQRKQDQSADYIEEA